MMRDVEIASVKILPEGIIELIFLQENITLNKAEVEAGWDLAKHIDKNKTMPILLKTGAWTLLDQEAREFAITEMKSWPRVSIVVHNLGQMILGSIAIKWMGKSDKIKLFESEVAALKWLKSAEYSKA